ncbi:MAG: twin-arginine translocase subunit TatB [Oligoflexales bacterium]|nr:twin-arginine translocase subunit TatB [Oligoflexales bacterium]
MLGIGFVELCVIIVVALVFVGPKKLPEMMKQAGKFFVQVRRMTTDVKSTMDEVIHEAEQEIRKEEREHLTKLIVSDENKKEPSLSPEGAESADPRSQPESDPHHDEMQSHEPIGPHYHPDKMRSGTGHKEEEDPHAHHDEPLQQQKK